MYDASSHDTVPAGEVSFAFHGAANGEHPATVRSFRLRERLSEPYRCRVELAATIPGTIARLGDRASVEISRAGVGVRTVHGIVAKVRELGSTPEGVRVRVDLVPALWTLGQRVDYRIFQDQDVPSIIESVLRDAGMYSGCARGWRLRRTHARRGYCVQYGESDLAFITRLMDEEGIAYIFEQDTDGERLVLVDEPGALTPERERVIPTVTDRGHTTQREVLWAYNSATSMRPTAVMLEDYNPDHPAVVEGMRPTCPREHGARVVREYPGRFTEVGAYTREVRSLGQFRARTSYEREQARGATVHAAGDVTWMGVGSRITVQRDDDAATASVTDLVVVSMDHKGRGGDHGAYENSFEAIEGATAGWPREPAPRPRVHGPQTAVVVSTTGEAVDVDAQRRVLLRFRWDLRTGVAQPTCRVRVAQALAGNGWGTMFIPREGMEVVVQFLDGDPDRPLVTGCVYNGENIPPHDHAAEATKTTIRTSSVPGGQRHHELTFDDAREHPEVYLHAAGVLRESVDGEHIEHVGGNRVETVGRNELVTVHGNATRATAGTESLTVGADQLTNVRGVSTLHVTGNLRVQTGAEEVHVAHSKIQMEVGRSTLSMEPRQVGVSIGPGASGQDGGVIEFKTGSAFLKITDSRIILSTGGAQIVLHDDKVFVMGKIVSVGAGGKVDIHAGGELALRGAPVHINC